MELKRTFDASVNADTVKKTLQKVDIARRMRVSRNPDNADIKQEYEAWKKSMRKMRDQYDSGGITAFLEGQSFEDVIRTAVSLGGDCDTLTCIAGSMAEAFYGVTGEMKEACRDRLPADILEVLDRFEEQI